MAENLNAAQELLAHMGKQQGKKEDELKLNAKDQDNTELTDDQKAENERLAKEKEEADKAAAASSAPGAAPQTQASTPKEEDLLALYNTKFGTQYKSIAELNAATQKTENNEDKVAKEQREKEEAFKFAVTNGIVNQEEIEAYSADKNKAKLDIYKQLYTDKLKGNKAFIAKIKEDNPDANKEELAEKVNEAANEQYNQYMFIDSEDEVRKSMRQEEAELFVDTYLHDKHKKFFGLEEHYKNNVASTQKRTSYNQKVDTTVASLSNELEIPVELTKEDGTKETFNYKYKFSAEDIAAIHDQFKTDDIYGTLGNKELTEDQLKASITNALLVKNFNTAVQVVANAHYSAMKEKDIADRKHIPEANAHGSNERGGAPAAKGFSGPAAAVFNQMTTAKN